MLCFPSDGRPIALGREPKKNEGGAVIMLDLNWIGASSYKAVYLVHRMEALV